jgi:hypothetical protein
MTHPLFQGKHNIGDLIDAVLGIHTPSEALSFYNDYVEWIRALRAKKTVAFDPSSTPEDTARSNIGWCFGEGMPEQDVVMWSTAVGASHPVFGTAVNSMTPQQLFDAGAKTVKDDA